MFNGVRSTSGVYADENYVKDKYSSDAAERREVITAAKSLRHGRRRGERVRGEARGSRRREGGGTAGRSIGSPGAIPPSSSAGGTGVAEVCRGETRDILPGTRPTGEAAGLPRSGEAPLEVGGCEFKVKPFNVMVSNTLATVAGVQVREVRLKSG